MREEGEARERPAASPYADSQGSPPWVKNPDPFDPYDVDGRVKFRTSPDDYMDALRYGVGFKTNVSKTPRADSYFQIIAEVILYLDSTGPYGTSLEIQFCAAMEERYQRAYRIPADDVFDANALVSRSVMCGRKEVIRVRRQALFDNPDLADALMNPVKAGIEEVKEVFL